MLGSGEGNALVETVPLWTVWSDRNHGSSQRRGRTVIGRRQLPLSGQRGEAGRVGRAYAKGKSLLEKEQPALAIPELQAAVAIDPENVDAQANLGVLLFFQGKAAEAIPHFRAALARQPDLAKIHGLLGLAESRTQDTADAREDMEAAFPLLEDRRFQAQVGLELVSIYTLNSDLDSAAAVIAQLRKADADSPNISLQKWVKNGLEQT